MDNNDTSSEDGVPPPTSSPSSTYRSKRRGHKGRNDTFLHQVNQRKSPIILLNVETSITAHVLCAPDRLVHIYSTTNPVSKTMSCLYFTIVSMVKSRPVYIIGLIRIPYVYRMHPTLVVKLIDAHGMLRMFSNVLAVTSSTAM